MSNAAEFELELQARLQRQVQKTLRHYYGRDDFWWIEPLMEIWDQTGLGDWLVGQMLIPFQYQVSEEQDPLLRQRLYFECEALLNRLRHRYLRCWEVRFAGRSFGRFDSYGDAVCYYRSMHKLMATVPGGVSRVSDRLVSKVYKEVVL